MPVRVNPNWTRNNNQKQYQAYWLDETKKQRSKNFHLKTQAKEYARKKQVEVDNSIYLSPKSEQEKFMLFSTFVKNIPVTASADVEESTIIRNLGFRNRHILPYFSDFSINKINNQNIQNFVDLLASNNLSKSSINIICSDLNRIFKKARSEGLILHSPMEYIYKQKVKETIKGSDEGNFFTVEEALNLYNAFATCCTRSKANHNSITGHEGQCVKHLATLVLVAFHTGARIGELRALEMNDINLNDKIISISKSMKKSLNGEVSGKTKTKSSIRDIPISDNVANALAMHMKIYNRSNYVFETITGSQVQQSKVNKALKEMLNVIGIDKNRKISFHSLRHTFAAICREDGRSLEELRRLLGHAEIRTTEYHYGAFYKKRGTPLEIPNMQVS